MWLSLGMCAKLFAPGRICFACQVLMSWSCCRSSLFILLLFGWSIFSVTDFFKWGNESKGGGVLVQLKELMWKAGQERNMYQSCIPLYVLCVDILLVYLSNQILAVLGGNSLWVYNWIVVLRPCLQCDSRWNNRAHECQFEGIRSHFLGILLRLTEYVRAMWRNFCISILNCQALCLEFELQELFRGTFKRVWWMGVTTLSCQLENLWWEL